MMFLGMRQLPSATTTAAAAYSRVAADYDKTFDTPLARAENRVIAAILAQMMTPQDRVLDLGSGTGLLLDLLAIDPARYVGIDIADGMLSTARAKYPQHMFLRADMADLHELAEEQFTLAVCLFGVFTYTPQPVQAIQEMVRVLAPRGRFLLMISTPAYEQRPSYCMSDINIPRWRYTAAQVRAFFADLPIAELDICGFHARAETHYPMQDEQWYVDYLRNEMHTLGRADPDSCYNLLVCGTRR